MVMDLILGLDDVDDMVKPSQPIPRRRATAKESKASRTTASVSRTSTFPKIRSDRIEVETPNNVDFHTPKMSQNRTWDFSDSEPESLMASPNRARTAEEDCSKASKLTRPQSKRLDRVQPQTLASTRGQPKDSDDLQIHKPAPKRAKTARKKTEKPVIVLGVDVGMWGCGISSALATNLPENVVPNILWSGSQQRTVKVPSIVAFKDSPGNKDHEAFEEKAVVFGYEVKTTIPTSNAFFKLSVDPKAVRTDYDDLVLDNSEVSQCFLGYKDDKTLGEKGKAMTAAMRHLFEIHRTNAAKKGQPFDEAKLKTVLTHPAACSNSGKARLEEFAEKAGWKRDQNDEIVLMSEAHAAGIAAFVDYRNGNWGFHKNLFEEQFCFTVLDFGSLTIDAASFVVERNDPQLTCNEVTVPMGGRCGTVASYCRLYEHVFRLLGKPFADLKPSEIGRGSEFMNAFEEQLHCFDGKHLHREIHLPLVMPKDFANSHYSQGSVALTGEITKSFLDETLSFIYKLLSHQFEQPLAGSLDSVAQNEPTGSEPAASSLIKTVIFCGGGSLCPYIFKSVEDWCQVRGKAVVQPDNPQSCVVKGAVMSCLSENLLGQRVHQVSYGVSLHQQFREGIDREEDRFECQRKGPRAKGYVHWHIEKGDIIDTNKPPGGRKIPAYISGSIDELLEAEKIHPTALYRYAGNDPLPERHDHKDVYLEGFIDIDLSKLSPQLKTSLRRKYGDGNAKIELTILQLVSSTGQVRVEIKAGTRVLGKFPLRMDTTRGRN